MLNTLVNATLLNLVYTTNSFLYLLRKLPLIGKKIPQKIYSVKIIKIIAGIISVLIKIALSFTTKYLYLFLMLVMPLSALHLYNKDAFIITFIIFSIIGSLINNEILQATPTKYYACILMRMDAQKYAISNYIFYLIKIFVTYLPALFVFGLSLSIPWYIIILLDLFVILIKPIGEMIELFFYKTKKIVIGNDFKVNVIIGIVGIALALGLSWLQIPIPDYIIYSVVGISIPIVIYGFINYINKSNYHTIYKERMTVNAVYFNTEEARTQMVKDSVKVDQKTIDLDDSIKNKKGYDYFNTIFFLRHRKILLKSAVKTALIILAVISVLIIAIFLEDSLKENIHVTLMTSLPYLIFIMYAINRGTVVTQAMFFNCDHSMLTYKFYREKNTILSLFKERLKTLIYINTIPAIVLAVGIPILIGLSGTVNNPFLYISTFLAIVSMSIFFSVHYLILYYLLQPYDINMKTKSYPYTIICSLTYLLCFFCMKVELDTWIFSLITVLATISYVGVALLLIYRYAPKTFKLK